MKKFLMAVALAAAAFASPALAADVGVSISLGHPGFFGQIDIGDFPAPQVIHPRPIIIERGVSIDRPPVYLRVPHKHRKNWKKYCRKYGACGEQVIFVRDDWYTREYVPRYQERHRERRDHRHDERRGEGRGGGHDDRRDRDHGRDR